MFPFRFYGERPIEWHEGANEGHAYDVTFVKAPTAARKRKLASAYEKASKQGAATGAPSRAWRWHDRSVRLYLGERKVGQHAKYFAAVPKLLERLHKACPIESVVFVGSWGDPIGKGAWDKWSLREGPAPESVFGPEQRGEVDPAFERERRVARLGKDVVEAEEAEAKALAESGALALLPTTEPVVAPVVPAGTAERFELGVAKAHYAAAGPSGRIVAMGTRFGSVAWVDDNDEIQGWGEAKLAHGWPMATADGSAVFAVLEGDLQRIVRIDLASCTDEPVLTGTEKDPYIKSVCPIGEDRLACATTKHVALLQRGADGWAVLDTYHPGERTYLRGDMLALHGGRVLLYVEGDHIRVLRVDEGKLDEFGRIDPPTPRRLVGPKADGKRVIGIDGKTKASVELVNLDARWRERWGDPPWD